MQAAFTCIKQLWNRRPLKVYGGRMAESMLAILCHILRGEPLIRERLGREREGPRGEEEAGGEEGGPRREPQVNQQQLQQVGARKGERDPRPRPWTPNPILGPLTPSSDPRPHPWTPTPSSGP